MGGLTYEEYCLINCFDGGSKDEVIADIENKLLYLDDEMKVFTQKTLQKIKGMTNVDFNKLFK